jgi:hypothetical protein
VALSYAARPFFSVGLRSKGCFSKVVVDEHFPHEA